MVKEKDDPTLTIDDAIRHAMISYEQARTSHNKKGESKNWDFRRFCNQQGILCCMIAERLQAERDFELRAIDGIKQKYVANSGESEETDESG